MWRWSKWSAAFFQHISTTLNLACNKNKLYKTLDHWSRDMLNLDFLEMVLEVVSPRHFVYDFSRKMFLMLYSINCPNFLVLIHTFTSWDIRQFVYYNCFFPVCDFKNFEINVIFLIKPLFYMSKKSREKFKYLDNKKSF